MVRPLLLLALLRHQGTGRDSQEARTRSDAATFTTLAFFANIDVARLWVESYLYYR